MELEKLWRRDARMIRRWREESEEEEEEEHLVGHLWRRAAICRRS